MREINRDYLVKQGVDDAHIIEIALEKNSEKLRNLNLLYDHVINKLSDEKDYHLFIDELATAHS